MVMIRKAEERGCADRWWLKSYHTFSFGSYSNPAHAKFRSLRVINEDWIKGGKGFGTHPHKDLEIITYIISGELEHRDSMGNGSVIRRGEMQRMTAGTGITHSEFNPTHDETHLLQIWIFPERNSLEPSYEQRDFSHSRNLNAFTLLASQCGIQDSLTVHQNMELYRGLLDNGKQLVYKLPWGRHVWIQMIKGDLIINGEELGDGDGAGIGDESLITIVASSDSEFLLFDLA